MKGKKGSLVNWLPLIGVFAIVCGLFGFVWFLAAWDRVEASHIGVADRLGELRGEVHPGLHHTGVLTAVHQYKLRTRKVQIVMTGDNAAADKDGQYVTATINVNYRLKKDAGVATELYLKVGKDKELVNLLNINEIVTEGFKQATVKFGALEILESRQEVKELAKANIHNNFPKQYFEIENIVVTNIDFHPDFKNEIQAKKNAIEAAKKEEQLVKVVEFQQQQKVAVAEADKKKKILEAEAEAERTKLQAEADATRLRLQRQEITPLLNQQLMYQQWDGNLPNFLILGEGGEAQNMFLNLPESVIGGQTEAEATQ